MCSLKSSVLVDLSGTLHIDDEVTCNAVHALQRLRSTGVSIKFVTNTTKESRRILYERLLRLGFDIKEDEIFSSLWAARDLVKRNNLKPMYFLDEAALEDFEDLLPEANYDSVVVGLAPDKFNWAELTKAFRLLVNGGKLVAIHAGRYYKRKDGLALGPGAFVKALEYSAGLEATLVGKPSSDFFLAALGNTPPTEAIMIGDDVQDDIRGALNTGIDGYLVKTGKYLPGDEKKIEGHSFKIVENFSEAVDDIISRFFKK